MIIIIIIITIIIIISIIITITFTTIIISSTSSSTRSIPSLILISTSNQRPGWQLVWAQGLVKPIPYSESFSGTTKRRKIITQLPPRIHISSCELPVAKLVVTGVSYKIANPSVTGRTKHMTTSRNLANARQTQLFLCKFATYIANANVVPSIEGTMF